MLINTTHDNYIALNSLELEFTNKISYHLRHKHDYQKQNKELKCIKWTSVFSFLDMKSQTVLFFISDVCIHMR